MTLGAIKTFTDLGGKVAKLIWNPIGTKDYGTTISTIPANSDGVAAIVVGADRIRLFEDWFNFGMDKKMKIFGGYWLQEDMLPQIDDRAVGLVANSLHYAAGIDTPENKAFVDAYVKAYKRLPSWFSESAYTAGLWTRPRSTRSRATSRTRTPSSRRCARFEVKAPRGPLKLDAYDNPIQNVYIAKIEKMKHPVLGEVLIPKPVKTYEAVSQFWTWKPEEFLARGPYKR